MCVRVSVRVRGGRLRKTSERTASTEKHLTVDVILQKPLHL